MASKFILTFLWGPICWYLTFATSTRIMGNEIIDVLKLLDNYKPGSCYDGETERVYATWNLFGVEYNVYCGHLGETYIKARLKNGIKFVDTEIDYIHDDLSLGSEHILHSYDLHRSLFEDEIYELQKSDADDVDQSDVSRKPYVTLQLENLKTVKPVLDSISALISDYCLSAKPEDVRLGLVRGDITIPVIIPRCTAGKVEFIDDRTWLIRGDKWHYYWSTTDGLTDMEGYDEKSGDRVMMQMTFKDMKKMPIHRPDVETMIFPVDIFREDLQELWKDVAASVTKKGWLSWMSDGDDEGSKGSIGLEKKTILTVGKRKKAKRNQRKDMIRIRGEPLPDIFFADDMLRDDSGFAMPSDGLNIKGLMPIQSKTVNKVQYASFERFRELLSKPEEIARVMKKSGTVKIRFVFGDHAIPATFTGNAFAFEDLRVLRACTDGSDQYAFRSKFRFVCFYQEFLAEGGDLNDAFAVRLQPVKKLPEHSSDVVVETVDIGVPDWKAEVIIPKSDHE